MYKKLRIIALFIAVVMFAAMIISCSAKADNSVSPEEFDYYGYDSAGNGKAAAETGAAAPPAADADFGYSEAEKPSYDGSTQNSITDTRKIIKTVSLELETKKFNDAVAQITNSAAARGGYIEYSYVSGESMDSDVTERRANFTIRIPAAVLDEYVNSLSGDFNVLSKTENSSDITDVYYDSEARLKSLQTQEERLLKMLEGATELQYMLQIEQTLADVRYQIESYYSTIKRYDSQVSLSTVTINLYEVIEYKEITEKPKTYGERLGQAVKDSWKHFVDGLEDLSVDFVYSIPALLVLAVFAAIVFFIIRGIIRKNRRKKEEIK